LTRFIRGYFQEPLESDWAFICKARRRIIYIGLLVSLYYTTSWIEANVAVLQINGLDSIPDVETLIS